ncbi:MAG: hypothetical protein KDA80_07830 [Planctomycetaceae bacterium]|nr:hypothetical protein [Planctomycetaceae bacterium]
MADARLLRRLDQVADRLARLRTVRTLTVGWVILLVLAVLAIWDPELRFFAKLSLLAGIPAVILTALWRGRRRATDREQAAVLIEETFPDLDSRLLTALQQRPKNGDWAFSFLQTELLTQVFTNLSKADLNQTVPARRFAWAHAAHFAAFIACLGMAVALFRAKVPQAALPQVVVEETETPITSEKVQAFVEPGDAEVERGSSVVVIARFEGPVPREVQLVSTNENGETERVPLKKSLDDPIFGGRLASVESGVTYHVEYDGESSDDYRISVFDYPALLRADADIQFPEYTGLEEQSIEDVRKLSVVEGSAIDLSCLLNKPVTSAVFVNDDGDRIPLELQGQEDGTSHLLHWLAETPGKKHYRLELVDLDGRQNKVVPEFEINVLANQLPDLKVSFPGRDVRVSALQEMALAAAASDDFGLKTVGFTFEKPDGQEETVTIDQATRANEELAAEHLLPLETMDAEPNDLISYYFFAEDIGPDGQIRRAMSDIFFAEVRPFEEIFRQSPAQSGQQQQQQQQQQEQGPAAQLLELQRQIVTGSWNVLRRERSDPPSDKFREDVQVLLESQEQVRELANEVAGEAEDELLKEHAENAVGHMTDAIADFQAATTAWKVESLRLARADAQEAYRDLLHLQSREKQVQNSQSQSQSQSSSSQQRMNQQLQALKLQNDRDRYETERQAQQQQDDEKRESLQVLNRLRELARRQEDLNERIRELENALRNAQTEEEKEEIERRLKRLQEEQQELLRDLDEVQQRMNNEQNRQRMADAREQVEQTRERVMRASEALEQGQTSRALTEGTRAERQLEQLKEDFRKQTAGQFDDAVRQLQREVRDLAEKEDELAKSMSGDSESDEQSDRPSLRTELPDNREEIATQLREQKGRVTDVLDRTRQLVEESETSEPLLSDKLYESMRDLRQYQPEESLENAARLARYGVMEEAQQLEERAREGIQKLQSGIDDAARSILGDEDEALRLAQAELESLAESIRQELEQSRPRGEASSTQSPGTEIQNSQSNDRPANPEGGRAGGAPENGDRVPGIPSRESNPDADTKGQPTPSDDSMTESETGSVGDNQDGEGQRSNRTPMPGIPRNGQGDRSPGEQGGGRDPSSNSRGNDSQERMESGEPRNGEPSSESPPEPSGKPSEHGENGRPSRVGSGQGQSDQQRDGQPQEGQPQSGQRPSTESQESQQGGSSPGQPPRSNQPGQQGGQEGGQQPGGQPNNSPGNEALAQSLSNLFNEGSDQNGGGGFGPHNPLTGESFRDWSDRMRDVEEMLNSPDLRARAATIRDRARQVRIDVKRHSKQPNWDLVRTSIYGPLVELQQLVAEERARRDPNESTVPLDRDPVPDEYVDLVRKYYEELSRRQAP